METECPRCRKCGLVIDSDPNVVFPTAGGVEHLQAARLLSERRKSREDAPKDLAS
jgi:hypothetical protein